MRSPASTQIGLCVVYLALAVPARVTAHDEPSYAPGVVIVKLKGEEKFTNESGGVVHSGSPELNAVIQRYGALEAKPLFPPNNADQKLRAALGLDGVYILRFSPAARVEGIVEDLTSIQNVEYAEPDYVGHAAGVAGVDPLIPNDTYFSRQ